MRLQRPYVPVVALLAVLSGGVALSACGGGSPVASGSAGPKAHGATSDTIVIKNFAFHPAHDVVAPGAKITVTNKDSVTHTLTSLSNAFNTGDLAPGKTTSITAPQKAGRYPYRCNIHQYMTGTLVVR